MISLRLDDEAERALRLLTRNGRSQSDAIRDALVAAAGPGTDRSLTAEAMRLAADPDDRQEKAVLLAIMDDLAQEG
jgi:Arc/MetJ-type ribon-helix-helix transcriptional regulator